MRSLGRASAMSLAWLCAAVVATAVVSIAYAAQTAGSEYMPICNLPKCLNPQVTSKSGIGTTAATVEAKIAPDDATKWCATYKPRDKYCPKEQVQSGWVGFRSLYRATADCVAGRMTGIDGNTYAYAGIWEDGPGKGRARFATSNPRVIAQKWDEPGVTVDGSGTITGWGSGSPNLAAQWEVLCAGAPAPAVK
jgi:hypothetical protein